MKRFFWIITLPIAVAVTIFAVSNRDPVALDLFPLPWQVEVRAFLVLLGSLAVGILIGLLLAWFAGGSKRKLARRLRRANERQATEIRELRASLDEARRAPARTGSALAIDAATPPAPLPPTSPGSAPAGRAMQTIGGITTDPERG